MTVDIHESVIKLMNSIQAAAKILMVYPITSESAVKSINSCFQDLIYILEASEAFTITQMDNVIIINEDALGPKEMSKSAVSAFLDLMTDFEIGSIEFISGVETDEMTSFLKLLINKPEDLEGQGGFIQVAEGQNFKHIVLEEAGGMVGGKISLDVFYQDVMGPMFKALAQHIDQSAMTKVAQTCGKNIVGLEEALIAELMVRQKSAGKFGVLLNARITDNMSVDLFDKMLERIQGLHSKAKRKAGVEPQTLENIKQTREDMLNSEKGQKVAVERKKLEAEAKIRKQKEDAVLKTGINKILKDDFHSFENKVIVAGLADTIDQFLSKGKTKSARTLMSKIGMALLNEDPKVRSGAAMVLIKGGARYLEEADSLYQNMIEWLKCETSLTDNHQALIGILTQYAVSVSESAESDHSGPLMEVFNQILSHAIPKKDGILELISASMSGLAGPEKMEPLFQSLLTGDASKRKDAIDKLSKIGSAAIDPLLDLLQKTQNPAQSTRIMQVLTDIGPGVILRVPAYLEKGSPLFLSYLLQLISKFGDRSLLDTIKPLLEKPDYNVRKECANAIYNIGGKNRENIFIGLLKKADDRFKAEVIRLLGLLQSNDAEMQIMEILEDPDLIKSQYANELAANACTALGQMGASAAIMAINAVMKEKKKGLLSKKSKEFNQSVKSAAAKAVKMLSGEIPRPKKLSDGPVQKSKAQKSTIKIKTFKRPGLEAGAVQMDVAEIKAMEQKAQKLTANDPKAAVDLLLELVKICAAGRDFGRAEFYRDRMNEIDSLALTEIFAANEAIDKAKAGAIDKGFMESWSNLFSTLTEEESNALYYGLQTLECGDEEVICQQGKLNQKLYFADTGQIYLSFRHNDQDVELKLLEKGQPVGADHFFGISMASLSLKAAEDAKVKFLTKETLSKWETDLPALSSKLSEYCYKNLDIAALFKEKKLDRRQFQRQLRSGKLLLQLFKSSGKPLGKQLKGEFNDLSPGGLSFYIKLPKKEAVPHLLGLNLNLKFNYLVGKNRQKADCNGKIAAITFEQFSSDYCVHVKLDQPIQELIEE